MADAVVMKKREAYKKKKVQNLRITKKMSTFAAAN
jgi:hypothetical protein